MKDQGELFGEAPDVRDQKTFLLSGAVEEELQDLDLIDCAELREEVRRLREENGRLRDENDRLLDDPGANRSGKYTVGRSGSVESQAAALREWPKTGTKRAEVLRLLIAYPDGLADYQTQELTRWDIRCVNARRKELEQGGWVVKSPTTRLAPSGNHVAVWTLSLTGFDRVSDGG